MTTVETEYKGHPTLEMTDDAGRKVTLGLTKLRAVLANLDAVRAFTAKHVVAKADTTNKPLF